MTNRLIAALVCLGMTSAATAAEIDFNKSVDITKAIEQATSVDVKGPGGPGWDNNHGQWDHNNFNNYPGPHPNHISYSRDCHTFNFGPSGTGMNSEVANLQSVEYVQECHYVPDPPPPPPQPNPGPNPQPGPHPQPGPQPFPGPHGPGGPGDHGGQPGNHGGPGHRSLAEAAADEAATKGMQCNTIPGDVFRRTAQLTMAPRQLLPWENDSFEVCAEGPNVEIRTLSAAYSYNINQTGSYDVRYDVTPLSKIATAPDHNGLSLGEFAFKDGKFVMNISDMWASIYAGEKVSIKVELVKDGFLFFNSSLGTKVFTLDASNGYQLSFVEGDLAKTKDFVDTRGDVRGPKKYFVKWGFSRVGNISTQEYVDKGSTAKITQ